MITNLGIFIALIFTAGTGSFSAYKAVTDRNGGFWIRFTEITFSFLLFCLTVVLASFFKH